MNNKILAILLAIGLVLSITWNFNQQKLIGIQDGLITQQQSVLTEAKNTLLQCSDTINQCSEIVDQLYLENQKLTVKLNAFEPKTEGLAELKPVYNVYATVKDPEGNIKSYSESHNVLVNNGKDFLKVCLGVNASCGSSAFDFIAVGNGSAPTSASTSLANEIAESGLSRSFGTYTSTGTGAWKVEKVFTVTGNVNSINSTAILNASSSGTLMAGDTFSNTNVANGDSLNITWTASVS